MKFTIRSAAGLGAVSLLAAACASNDHPYAHETAHHPTAAEQLFGTTGGELAAAPPSSAVTTEPAVMPQPVVTAEPPSAPLTVPQPVARVAASDASFVQQVAGSSAAEIELARLAYVRAQSPDVRAFARQMLIDHRDMAIQLDNFALERGYLITWQIPADKAQTIQQLSGLSGPDFDRAYMNEMVAAHENTVTILEAQSASGRETASVADAALPTVRHHLEMARALDARV